MEDIKISFYETQPLKNYAIVKKQCTKIIFQYKNTAQQAPYIKIKFIFLTYSYFKVFLIIFNY